MFVLKGLGRFIWGDPSKTEIVQIPAGQLYLVRPKSSVKGTSECMYVSLLYYAMKLMYLASRIPLLRSAVLQPNLIINLWSNEHMRKGRNSCQRMRVITLKKVYVSIEV